MSTDPLEFPKDACVKYPDAIASIMDALNDVEKKEQEKAAVTTELLVAMGATRANAEKYVDALREQMERYGTNTRLRVAHFLAQLFHESNRLSAVSENLNYSADGLLKTFPKYFDKDSAQKYARKKVEIANRVYAGRNGNGDEAGGDGYRYRGRGLIQLTFKDNYEAFAKWVNDDDVLTNPDKVATEYAVHSAIYYWDSRKLNALADKDDVVAVTKKINGGTNGLDERRMYLKRAKELIQRSALPEVLTAEPPP